MLNSLNKMRITLPTDENGLTGRQCPAEDCEGYYKIKFGTGVKEEGYDKCFCPYCGYRGTQNQFFTKDQVSHIKSIAVREVEKAIGAEIKKWDRNLQQSTRNSFIKLRVNYKSSNRPIHYYTEQELETHLICDNCGLEYAVFGKFSYCPDCGVDNTLQILRGNLDLIRKLIERAKSEEDQKFQDFLFSNALEDIVSTFDSFGRNCVRLFTKDTNLSGLEISFQNIKKVRARIREIFGFDFMSGLTDEQINQVVKNFQKRHLITHNDGVIDDTYIKVTKDSGAVIGRKIALLSGDIEEMLSSIDAIAQNLQSGLSVWKSTLDSKGGNND